MFSCHYFSITSFSITFSPPRSGSPSYGSAGSSGAAGAGIGSLRVHSPPRLYAEANAAELLAQQAATRAAVLRAQASQRSAPVPAQTAPPVVANPAADDLEDMVVDLGAGAATHAAVAQTPGRVGVPSVMLRAQGKTAERVRGRPQSAVSPTVASLAPEGQRFFVMSRIRKEADIFPSVYKPANSGESKHTAVTVRAWAERFHTMVAWWISNGGQCPWEMANAPDRGSQGRCIYMLLMHLTNTGVVNTEFHDDCTCESAMWGIRAFSVRKRNAFYTAMDIILTLNKEGGATRKSLYNIMHRLGFIAHSEKRSILPHTYSYDKYTFNKHKAIMTKKW